MSVRIDGASNMALERPAGSLRSPPPLTASVQPVNNHFLLSRQRLPLDTSKSVVFPEPRQGRF
jgi:hypothetical protein